MGNHSEYGPSSAERWLNCPGSVRLGRDLPALPSSRYAAEGSVAHGLAEKLCKGELTDMDLMAKVGDTIVYDEHEIEVTEEMVSHVLAYASAVHRDVQQLRLEDRPAAVFSHIELKVRMRLEGEDDEEVYGTADNVIYRKGHKMIVRDLKYGKGKPVNVVENIQAGIYALGAQDSVCGEAFDDVELVIDQPRINGERRWSAPKDWLRELRYRVAAGVKATKAPDAPLKAGSWCRWCKAQSICPEIQAAQQREAEVDFRDAPPLPVVAGTVTVNQAMIDAATPERLARLLDWEEPLTSFYRAAKARAKQLLEQGVTLPGWKLVDGRSNRKWGEGYEDAVVATMGKLGRSDKAYAPRELLSPAKMESVVGKKDFAEHLSRFIVRPEPKKTLAQVADPRPETVSSAEADFAAAPPLPVAAAAALPAPAPAPVVDDFFGGAPPQPKKAPIWPV